MGRDGASLSPSPPRGVAQGVLRDEEKKKKKHKSRDPEKSKRADRDAGDADKVRGSGRFFCRVLCCHLAPRYTFGRSEHAATCVAASRKDLVHG